MITGGKVWGFIQPVGLVGRRGGAPTWWDDAVIPDTNIIRLKKEKGTLDTIKQFFVLCESREERFQATCNIYGAIVIAQAIIFCQVGHLWTLPENTGQRSNSFFFSPGSRGGRLQAGSPQR